MSFTHKQLYGIEWDANRAINAIRQFSTSEVDSRLKDASFILAAVRSAGQFLCNPSTSADDRVTVINNLVSDLYS